MEPNIGKADAVLRILIGAGLLAFFATYAGEARWLGLIGAFPLCTVIMRWSPVYIMLGVRTRPRA